MQMPSPIWPNVPMRNSCFFAVACHDQDDATRHLAHRGGAVERIGNQILRFGEHVTWTDQIA